MKSLGEFLKKERIKRKLKLNDISKETNISEKYLKAIENDNYTLLPGEVYIIGYIRNYARVLGLNPRKVVNIYKSIKTEFTISIKKDSTLKSVTPKTNITKHKFFEKLKNKLLKLMR